MSSVQIDKERLSKLLKGKNLSEMSRKMGYGSNYHSNVTASSEKSGRMSYVAINLLEHIYGIMYTDYCIDNNIAGSKNEATVAELGKGEFYEVIYKAVYEAVKKAWAE